MSAKVNLKDKSPFVQGVLFKYKDRYGYLCSVKALSYLTLKTIKEHPEFFLWFDDIITALLRYRQGLNNARKLFKNPKPYVISKMTKHLREFVGDQK
jgi:hypothetical protein